MKADVSINRLSKKQEQEKNYKYLIAQQGRVFTDADWNDYVQIKDNHDTTSLRDIIGKNGVPLEQKDSFKITPIEGKDNRYKIGKGRIYVDGILVENFSEVEAFSNAQDTTIVGQPYLPSLFSTQGQPISDAVPTDPGIYLAYLDVWYRHITQLEDPNIQESALGGIDTTTRAQAIWQVKLHKLNDGEEATNQNPNEENKWADWIRLDNNRSSQQITDIRIGTNNDGNLLEVFALEFDDQTNRLGERVSRRLESLDPVKWETKWNLAGEDFTFSEIEIASIPENNLEILVTFGMENQVLKHTLKAIRDDHTRWGKLEQGTPNQPMQAKEIAIGNNTTTGEFHLFAIHVNDEGIYHSKKKKEEFLDEDEWKRIGKKNFTKLSVIFNPNNNCMEIYAIETISENITGRIWYTQQKESNSIEWEEWKEINPEREPGGPLHFDEIVVGLNSTKKQIVIFARELRIGKLWNTIRTEPQFPVGNGWSVVGDNQPGRLIVGSGSLSVQNNLKKQNRLEIFGIFSDLAKPPGKIWTIFEDNQNRWNLKWKIIDDDLEVIKVASATDKKSRVNIFAIQDQTGIVHHKYVEDTRDLVNCEMNIPSWESKIKPSTWQLKARTRVQPPLPDDPCLLPEQAGYRGLENQLYRIEIHETKSQGKNATFKYSRDNGTVCSKIVNISGKKITVASIGRDRLLGFKIGQWIEVTDDLHELWGIPGVLAHIENIEGTDLSLERVIPATAKIDNNSFPQSFNPKVRRWDIPEESTGALDVQIPSVNNGWIEIEDGIEVKFNNIDICKTADYITIPARTLKADIEWPKGKDGLPELVDIEGIKHHYVQLALLEYTTDGNLKLISDCRDFFPPLNSLDDLSPKPKTLEPKSLISWTHGTISQVNNPELLVSEHKQLNGTLYIQSFNNDEPRRRQNSFHFPMTVSYPLDPNKKITIQKIYLLYQTDESKIFEIAIKDAGLTIKRFRNLSRSGDFSNKPDEFILEPGVEIKYGINISVDVEFLKDFAEILFTSVGVQLKID